MESFILELFIPCVIGYMFGFFVLGPILFKLIGRK